MFPLDVAPTITSLGRSHIPAQPAEKEHPIATKMCYLAATFIFEIGSTLCSAAPPSSASTSSVTAALAAVWTLEAESSSSMTTLRILSVAGITQCAVEAAAGQSSRCPRGPTSNTGSCRGSGSRPVVGAGARVPSRRRGSRRNQGGRGCQVIQIRLPVPCFSKG